MEQIDRLSEKQLIEILKEFFTSNKIELYKRKLIAPMSYEAIFIVVINKKQDIEKELHNFIKSPYSLNHLIIFDTSEALIDSSKIEFEYLFFKGKIYV